MPNRRRTKVNKIIVYSRKILFQRYFTKPEQQIHRHLWALSKILLCRIPWACGVPRSVTPETQQCLSEKLENCVAQDIHLFSNSEFEWLNLGNVYNLKWTQSACVCTLWKTMPCFPTGYRILSTVYGHRHKPVFTFTLFCRGLAKLPRAAETGCEDFNRTFSLLLAFYAFKLQDIPLILAVMFANSEFNWTIGFTQFEFLCPMLKPITHFR